MSAERAIQALRQFIPREATVLRDGQTQKLPAAELVPGDVILLEEGDNIPADCRLVEAFSVRVNNATVTGESVPHSRDEQPSEEMLRDARVKFLQKPFNASVLARTVRELLDGPAGRRGE